MKKEKNHCFLLKAKAGTLSLPAHRLEEGLTLALGEHLLLEVGIGRFNGLGLECIQIKTAVKKKTVARDFLV